MPSCITFCSIIGNYTVQKEKIEEKSQDVTDNNSEEKRREGVAPLPSNPDEIQADLKTYEKSENDVKLIREAIEKNEFLNKVLTGPVLSEIVAAMYIKEIADKEIIIREGETGSHMYISASGKYKVTIKNKTVALFEDNRVFGELAILYSDKRQATITAESAGKLWVLDRSTYKKLTISFNIKEQEQRFEFLKDVPNLNKVSDEVLHKVTQLLKTEFFTTGTEIIKEGEVGDKFYIVSAGSVVISKKKDGVVGNCVRGQYFGELALFKEECRKATVTAEAPGVECLTLTRQEFIEHFGELGEEGVDSITLTKKMSGKVSSNNEYQNIQLNDLKIVKTLGIGGFGRVELVQHKENANLTFALKYLKKYDMVEQNQQEHISNEKTIQSACNSRFIVKLYRSYRDRKYIYFLMEACLGGDLWTHLQRKRSRKLEESEARFVVACVVLAFSYIHERGIVYRDLKPENLLIDPNGYVKVTDFGFAKMLGSRDRTFTFAGTPEYVAPEIILNRGHDKSVDYWTLGIFIFELLTGRTPFRTNDSSHMRTYNRILNGIDNVEFPLYVTKHAKHIIGKLCKAKALDRLGCHRNGIADVKNHKWFAGFDWSELAEAKMQSPFKPKLRSNVDTKYFDCFKQDNDLPPDENTGWDKDF